jgi:LCP family protein required for cell wall assembly
LAVGVGGAVGLTAATNAAVDRIARVEIAADVFSPPSDTVVNYLLVGSDSRAGGDPNTGEGGDVSGSRSDTIMVLRYDRATGGGSLLSIPRDLWVTVPGREGKRKINAAFNDGPAVLIQTIQQNLFLPIHHYAEVDFVGFTELVDAVGGVEVCFLHPTRDFNTGLDIAEPGCVVLDGKQSLAYTRSRYYEEFIDGEWRTDPTSDLGRNRRQREFVDATLRTAFEVVRSNPFRAGDVVDALGGAMALDTTLDPVPTAVDLRRVASGGLVPYSLPVRGGTIAGQSVLQLADGAGAVLEYFAGTAPPPPPG